MNDDGQADSPSREVLAVIGNVSPRCLLEAVEERMTIADLDRVIEALAEAALSGSLRMSEVREALTLLRTMRDNASETTYLRCPKCGQTGWSSVVCACDPATAQTERVLALLITPEDE